VLNPTKTGLNFLIFKIKVFNGRTKKKRQVVVYLQPLPAFFVLLAGFEPSRQACAPPAH
jgi:hypothetical protein